MRMILFVLAAFFASTPALAQGWEEYAYPDYAFAVAFPANPQVENTTFQIAPGRSVPARVYSVRQNKCCIQSNSRRPCQYQPGGKCRYRPGNQGLV